MSRETGRRIRAAREYAGLSGKELGSRIGRSESTIKRYESGKLPGGYELDGLLERVCEICDVGRDFFTVDFKQLAAVPADGTLERVDANVAKLLNQYLEDRVRLFRVAQDPPSAQAGDPKRSQGQ